MKNKVIETIIRLSYKVHRGLGSGYLERVYQNALVYELEQQGITAEKEKQLVVYYDKKPIGYYYADILVAGQTIVELKRSGGISFNHIYQVKHYLKALGQGVGLIISFDRKLRFKVVYRDD